MVRIASIDNISARAFRLVAPDFPATLDFMTPTETFRTLDTGQCDAALLPAACLPLMEERIETTHAFGIACTGTVSSVRLHSKYPLGVVVRTHAPIYVSEKSQTSRLLLSVLCRLELGIEPVITDNPGEAVAQLHIGEDALVYPNDNEAAWPHVRDLGAWWHEFMDMPFVFAVWVTRTGLAKRDRAVVHRWLEDNASLAESPKGQNLLSAMGLRDMTSERFALDYYARIRPRLNVQDLEGLEHYLALTEEVRPCNLSA